MLIFFRALAGPARGSRLLPLPGEAGGPRARCWAGCFLLRAERGDRPVGLVGTYHAAVMHGLVGLSVCLLSPTECKFPPRGSRCQRPGPFTAERYLILRRAQSPRFHALVRGWTLGRSHLFGNCQQRCREHWWVIR